VAVRLLLIGAPGSGKGTQAVRLADRFGITHISSGDLLREHVRNETPIGLTIKEYVDAGDLVPDSVVMDMLYKPVVTATEQGGYVLDGFPRTVEQAEAAYDVAHRLGAEVKASIHLDVPTDELVRRLLARSRGSEDSQEVIEHRLEVYQQKTVPLLEYYAQREWLFTVDGSQSEDEVHEAIARKVASMAPPASTD
jgi:adenylate kinase